MLIKRESIMSENSVSTERLSKRNLWGYSMGGIGRDMAYQLVNTYLLTFILFTKELTTAQFGSISVIMILCRIFDGCNDPFMGSLIEITRTKIGKFKPWILAGVITNVAVIMALFWVPLTGKNYVIFFVFGYLLWGITYTMNDISYWGMMPSLTSNPQDRNNLATLANIGAGIGAALAIVSIPFFTAGKFTIGGNAVTAYGVISAVVCAVFIACQIMTVLVVKEKPLPPVATVNGEKRTLKEMFKVIFHNDQLKPVMISMLFYSVGSAIMMGLSTYWIYFRFGYQGFLVTLFTVLSGISAVIIVFYPMLSKKHSRRWIAKLSMGMIFTGYTLLLVLGLITGATKVSGSIGIFVMLALCGAFASFGQTLFYQVLTISVANTVEYNEYTTGLRDEGVIFACRPFTTKLGSAICVGITSATLMILGVNNVTKKIAEQENLMNMGITASEEIKLAKINEIIAGVSPSVPQWLIVAMTVLPLLILAVSFIVYFKKYNISEERYDEICAEIAKRKLAAEVVEESLTDGSADVAELNADVSSSDAVTLADELEKEVASDEGKA